MVGFVRGLLESQLGVASGLAGLAAHGIVLLSVIVLGGVAAIVARRLLVRLAKRLARLTATRWDDVLVESGVVGRLASVVFVIVIYPFASAFGSAQPWIETGLLFCLVGIALRVLDALFDAGLAIYESYPVSNDMPLRGFVRLARIVAIVLGAVFVVTTTVERIPSLLGEELDAVLRADRADDTEDIPALLEHARAAMERVRVDDATVPEEGERLLQELRERGPALIDAAAIRVAELAEGEGRPDGPSEAEPGDGAQLSESLQALCSLIGEAEKDLAEDPDGGWLALAESCRGIDPVHERAGPSAK